MTVLSQILLARGFEPRPASKVTEALKRQGVPASLELDRILSLPRRSTDVSLVPDLTEVWRRPGGKLNLWPFQNWVLWEAEKANGIFGALAVGSGKTLCGLLLPDVLKSNIAVLLIPPGLRKQLLYRDIPFYNKHFNLDPILSRLKILAYTDLSSPDKAEILDQLKPDLIIADESHKLCGKDSARSKRFRRFLSENPTTRFVALSGTMTRKSITEYATLLEFALKNNSPLPRGFRERKDWASALDVFADREESDKRMLPGALTAFISDCDVLEKETRESLTTVRRAYRRRLVETIGVVATSEDALGTSLIIQARFPEVPSHISARLKKLRDSWEHEGEELTDPVAVYRVGKQLASGFYYKWAWPGGEPDTEWLFARANWHREMREILRRSAKGLDSPLLVANAAKDKRIETTYYNDWALVANRPSPPVETVWLDDYLVNECNKWATALEGPGIIFYEHTAFGKALSDKLNLPHFGAGEEASKALTTIDPKVCPVIVCSIAAHSEGKNLQMYSRMLVPSSPSSGKTWEQMIGRQHRPGQEADEVIVDVFLHTQESKSCFDQALKEAKYVHQTQGSQQKLLIATRIMK